MPEDNSAAKNLIKSLNIPARITGALGLDMYKDSGSDKSTNMNWKPEPNKEQLAEISRNEKRSASSSAGNGHPLTPRTSQRAQTRRDGTAAEYHKK